MAFTWRELVTSGWTHFSASRGANPEHLLWCLHFLKTYSTEEILSARVGANEKTFRRWAWFYAEGIALVLLSQSFNRFVHYLPVYLPVRPL